ncbi:hypothetical protein [Sphaerisporangium sp. TRM90804]|uniref:hypothetical protein n=1 Tax=Sphaerisporangium sp. TRM90804 TaxID=3031113 RepID=UPI00244D7857|nr:hypothetical protein [Sphaerisporangium sp. TRM90804]MDH2423888.1 hypothetical protein [Sphaerisporangium sp. TRM90804]
MRRWIATITGVVAATLIAPGAPAASADAAPSGAHSALARQFVAGHGVKISHSSTIAKDGAVVGGSAISGKLGFDRSGVVTSDLVARSLVAEQPGLKPVRRIAAGDATYAHGGSYDARIPPGVRWVKLDGGVLFGQRSFAPEIDLAVRTAYQGLLATAASKRAGGTVGGASTTRYSGTISLGKLYGLTPALRGKADGLSRSASATKVAWSLWLGRDLLPRRFSTAHDARVESLGDVRVSNTSTYSGWGSSVAIKTPADVIDIKDLPEDAPPADPTFVITPDSVLTTRL